MKTVDVLGKPCPIPVIEAKKALAEQDADSVLVKVDNIVAVQNLEKMAKGYGYGFAYAESAKDVYDVTIQRNGKKPPEAKAGSLESEAPQSGAPSGGLAVAVGRDTMGEGAEELGKILIKGFIYSLTALPAPPRFVIFFNSGARLTSDGANTVEDLKKLEGMGTEVLTCGTCVNYYGLQDKLAVGAITDMYGITERMASAGTVINI
ncbi:MAG: sulfurtransferase-like selenium metabolism protein YedF [Peptococcaceae bacterium]|jgi:selenium metabolism protein YedF|nr:sulfurtransferase-like selenium metabolism protein YedF [Peptococcaceae bacterium]